MIKTSKQFFLMALCSGALLTACTTLDYDDELNKSHQELIRLHQEDEKIRGEILEASYSLDHLIGEMSDRVNGEIDKKERSLQETIAKEDSLIRVFLDEKLGNADSMLNVYDSRLRNTMKQKEGEFNSACDILQQKMEQQADLGYQDNLDLLQSGIQKLNSLNDNYDKAFKATADRVAAIENIGTRLNTLRSNITLTQQKRDEILQKIGQLQKELQGLIMQRISDTKNSERYSQFLQNLLKEYQELIPKMQSLVDSFKFDESWYLEVETYIDEIGSLLSDSEETLERAENLQDLIESFDASKAEDIFDQLVDIFSDLEDLKDYDTSDVEVLEQTLDEIKDHYDGIMSYSEDINDKLSDMEKLRDEAEDFKNW